MFKKTMLLTTFLSMAAITLNAAGTDTTATAQQSGKEAVQSSKITPPSQIKPSEKMPVKPTIQKETLPNCSNKEVTNVIANVFFNEESRHTGRMIKMVNGQYALSLNIPINNQGIDILVEKNTDVDKLLKDVGLNPSTKMYQVLSKGIKKQQKALSMFVPKITYTLIDTKEVSKGPGFIVCEGTMKVNTANGIGYMDIFGNVSYDKNKIKKVSYRLRKDDNGKINIDIK